MGVLSRTPAPIDCDHPAAADLLRVVAAWAVATFHFWQQSWFSLGSDHWQRAGSIGVDLLVMLSAFCLFLPWANARQRGEPLPGCRPADFYRRRAARLLPAYYANLLASFLIALKRHGWSRALGLDLAAHLTLTQQLFPRSYIGTLLNGVTWTLTVFGLFYLVFPLLAPLCAKHPLPTVGALCLVQAGYSQWALHQYGTGEYAFLFNQFPAFCGVLAVGMAAALIFAELAHGSWTVRFAPRAACTALGVAAFVWLDRCMRLQAWAAEYQQFQLINRMPLALAAAAMLVGFGLGLTLGFAEDCFAVGAAGAALGVLARSFGTLTVESVCLLCALGAAVAARWLWPGRSVPAVAAGCGTLVGSAVCFAAGEENGVQTILFCGGDALLAAAAGYGLRRFPPEKPGMGSLILSAAVAAALGGMSFGFFLPGVMACAAAELALCCKGLPLEALAFSGVTGAALAASDPALAPAAAGLACGCAAAAVLAPARRVEGLAAYAGGCVTGVLCVQPLAGAFSFLLSAGAGAGLCALLPAGWLMPALKENDPPGDERPRLSAAATRLEAVAESLSSLAETVNEVYDAFPRRCEGFRWVIDNIHDGLCANCGRREVCWKQEHASTLEGMEALRPILEEKGHLEAALLPGQLARCIHPAALCAAGDKAFALYRSRREARVHSEAMRTALTEQYSAVADALGVLSEQLGRPGSPEPYKSGRVSALFAQLGTPPLECAVTLDDLGRTRAAVTLPRTRFNEKELAALAGEVGHICRRSLEPPQVLSCKGMTTLLFAEKPLLRAVFGTAGAAARGEISGDAVQQFCSAAAAQMILCDGMGTGRPAAVDGNLAAELTARLLKAGFTAELAARLVNVALALKSDEESGATLDLVSVDLYTGTARLFKAGAAPGFLVHGGKARAVGEASLPMGILGGVSGQSRVVHLAAGDYVVLVSDGLLVDGPGWVMQQLELSAAKAEQPDVLAKKLVEAARARAVQRGRPDDITAAVLRLENS